MNKGYQGEYDPDSYHGYLDQADIPAGKHLCNKQVVHVPQGEEGQAEKEERPSLFAMGEIVVPQHQAGQSRQNQHAKKEVESSEVQQDWKENKRRDYGQVHFSGSTPKPGHTNPVCKNISQLWQGFRFLRLPLQKPDK